MKFLRKTTLFALLTITAQSLCSLHAMDETTDRNAKDPLLTNQVGALVGVSKDSGTFPNVVDPATPLKKPTKAQFTKAGDVTTEATRILGEGHRLFTTSSLRTTGRQVHYTTLGGILNIHDELENLVNGAKVYGDLRTLIAADTFTSLQKLERGIRKMIHLIWGALMLEGDDLTQFREEKSAPYLFNREGFERTYKTWYGQVKETETRPATVYSFPDNSDPRIYVQQIRTIAELLNIDLDARLTLPFHPVEKEFRKKMAEAYVEDHPSATLDEAYTCMLRILAERKSTASSHNGSPVPSTSPVSGMASTANPLLVGETPLQKLLEELIPVRNKMKFYLIMDPTTATKLDGGETRQLIHNIVSRLNGDAGSASLLQTDGALTSPSGTRTDRTSANASVDDVVDSEVENITKPQRDPFMHPDLVSRPYGSPLKPITTAGYRGSQASLKAYWERTEAILAKAVRMVESNEAFSKIISSRSSHDMISQGTPPLDARVRRLLADTLHVVYLYNKSNPETKWPSVVTTMLEDSHLNISRGRATYVGDIRELSAHFAESLRPSTDNPLYPMGGTEAEVGTFLIEALMDHYEKITGVKLN
ncbi:MAG: hypothetical protein K2W94_05110 [Alphaproteobacteria bacterium]|nr:hypothetical protein [Alphaproteobacteria bacterium]